MGQAVVEAVGEAADLELTGQVDPALGVALEDAPFDCRRARGFCPDRRPTGSEVFTTMARSLAPKLISALAND